MVTKLFFFFLFFSAGLCAETRTYLVYRLDNFPQDRYLYVISPQEYKRFVDTGKQNITEASGQPFQITSYEISPTGKYATWTVTAKDADELWHIDSMEKQGYIVKISTFDVVSVYDRNKGGYISEPLFIPLSELPTDFYQVGVSTK